MINTLSKILLVAAAITLLAGAYNIYSGQNEIKSPLNSRFSGTHKTIFPAKQSLKKDIEVDAQVVPLKEVKVSSEIPGRIEWLGVSEGDKVSVGQHIASIEHSELLTQLAQAKARLAQARAELDKAKAGARKEDITIAEQKVTETKIQIESSALSLAGVLRSAIDKIDDNMEIVDEYFTDENSEKPQVNVRYLDESGQKDAETRRLALQKPLQSLHDLEIKLRDSEYVKSADIPTLLSHASLTTATLTEIKELVGNLESLASDALETHISFRRLKELQADMQKVRAATEAEKSKVDSSISAIKLANAKYEQARVALEKLEKGTRQEDLDALQANVDLAKAALETVQSKLDKASVQSPVSGTVSQVMKEQGEYVNSQEPIISIVTSGVYIKAQVPEVDIAKIHTGMPVSVKFDTYKSKRFNGKIYFIYPTQKEINGIVYYDIKVLLDKGEADNYDIKPGMTATVYIPVLNLKDKLTVPNKLIKKDSQGAYVYVIDPKAVNPNIPQKRYIKTGPTDGKYTVVLSGLISSDRLLADE